MGRQIIPGKAVDLRVELHSKIQVFRTLETFINKGEFSIYYETLDDATKTLICEHALAGNLTQIRKMYFDWQMIHYGFGDIRYLRSKASMLGVPYYTTLNKDQLMREIYNATHSEKVS